MGDYMPEDMENKPHTQEAQGRMRFSMYEELFYESHSFGRFRFTATQSGRAVAFFHKNKRVMFAFCSVIDV